MFNSVDLIGVEAVANMLKQTELKRFIIYRSGAGKGATPVYDCSHTQNNSQAVKSFKDWAENIMRFNPNNLLCYEMLAFDDWQNDEEDAAPKKTGTKTGKMRISFALNASVGSYGQNNNNQQIDISGEIQKGIAAAMMQHENNELKKRIKELEEEEEEEEEESEDIIGKVTKMMSEINKNNSFENAASMAGDTMAENLTEVKNKHGLTPAQLKIKNENISKAVKILFKHNVDIDKDLLKLANIAETNNILFKMILAKLTEF